VAFFLLVAGLFSACDEPVELGKVRGAILPHHLLVEEYIDDFYKELADDNVERVILLSPNHFAYGFNHMQTTNQNLGDTSPDLSLIETLADLGLVAIEPKDFAKEHGVTIHLPYIKEYFPNAGIVPIIFKEDVPQEKLDDLIEALAELENTFVLASIDFTHYAHEDLAMKNDREIIDWLDRSEWLKEENLFEKVNFLAQIFASGLNGSVGMDSPEAFYVFLETMRLNGVLELEVWRRTSSASLLELGDPTQNTSHIFVKSRP